MQKILEDIIAVSGIKIMWSLALGNLAIEFIYSLVCYLKKEKFNALFCMKSIVSHFSITHILTKRAKKIDAVCVIIVYIAYFCNNVFIKPYCKGFLRPFFTGHFNDTIATIMLLAYFNISISAKKSDKRIKKFM
jgi:hypothetical protein